MRDVASVGNLIINAGCGHCKRLAPAYEEVGTAFENSDTILIAKVDADAEKTLGSRFGVRGYPTLKYFHRGAQSQKSKSLPTHTPTLTIQSVAKFTWLYRKLVTPAFISWVREGPISK